MQTLPEDDQTARVVVVRVEVPVVEVRLVVVRLEVERVVSGLPALCSFPSKVTEEIVPT